jgi:hypothetical protein
MAIAQMMLWVSLKLQIKFSEIKTILYNPFLYFSIPNLIGWFYLISLSMFGSSELDAWFGSCELDTWFGS